MEGPAEPPGERPLYILDPTNAAPTGRGRLLIEDAGVRRLGKYPDIGQLQPGDILLFSPVTPDFAARRIIAAHETRGFLPPHTEWTHAAVYLRRGTIVEAVVPRVTTRDLWHYVPTRKIRVRRVRAAADPATFGYRLALEMTARIGEPYDTSVLWRIPLYSLFARGRGRGEDSTGRVFCSQLVADSFAALREGPIYRLKRPTGSDEDSDLDTYSQTTPAHLSATDVLEDINIPWLSVG